MTVYSINGAKPMPLPKRVVDSNGKPWTHLHQLSEAELADIGIVPADPEPTYDPATQHPPSWDGGTLTWTVVDKTQAEMDAEAAAEAAAEQAKRLNRVRTPVEFMRLFTQAERVAIRTAAAQSDSLAFTVRDFLAMTEAATGIALSDPDVQAGVPMLEVAGLLDFGRSDEILAGQPPA